MMKTDIADIYRTAWSFLFACPLLFLVPVVVEFAQHIVEWQLGMYDSIAGAKAAETSALRLQFGFAKTLALLLPGYWFARYILFGGDAARARRIEWPAIGLWLILFAIHAVQQWWGLFGPSLTEWVGLTGETGRWTGYALFTAGSVVGIYLTAWAPAWAAGNAAIGPIGSAIIMAGSFWRTIALLVVGILPLMILHYLLSFGAIFAPALLDWPLLTLDALVVGYLALTMTGAATIAARHAATRKGIDLTGEESAAMGAVVPQAT